MLAYMLTIAPWKKRGSSHLPYIDAWEIHMTFLLRQYSQGM